MLNRRTRRERRLDLGFQDEGAANAKGAGTRVASKLVTTEAKQESEERREATTDCPDDTDRGGGTGSRFAVAKAEGAAVLMEDPQWA